MAARHATEMGVRVAPKGVFGIGILALGFKKMPVYGCIM